MGDRAKLAASAAFYLLALAAQMSGWTNSAVAIMLAIIATALLLVPSWHHCRQWHLQRAGTGVMSTSQIILLIGIGGTWVFMTAALGAAGFMIWNTQGFAIGSSAIGVGAPKDEGPIQWVHNLTLTGGNPQVFALSFRGANISKEQPIELKEAKIVSLIDGTVMPLEIVAVDANGENKRVSLDKIQLIPPGAPIEVVATFGGLDEQGRIIGIDSKPFLEKWRQFAFTAKDDTRSYRMEFNENIMAVFFQGKVGPRVAVKP